MKIFLVGGAVRDSLLGVKSNDLDYVVVIEEPNLSLQGGYNRMKQYMLDEGFDIFLETPEMVTIRGRFPVGHKNEGITGDFVLARKEVGYEEGTRRPILELGTLTDDLSRRDFTINAMAEDDEGNLIDLFGGLKDLEDKVLRTPLDPRITFMDDPLRLIRGIRFSITKDFRLSESVKRAMGDPDILDKLQNVVSQERIREEFLKMFKHDSIETINTLSWMDISYCTGIIKICFGGDMWLKPTFEKK
jgi:tRNA nucleotidyltransferase/poly(A) polymerase